MSKDQYIVSFEDVKRNTHYALSKIKEPDYTDVIAIAVGGMVPGSIVAKRFPKTNVHVTHLSSYGDSKQSSGGIRVKSEIDFGSLGKNIIIVDDLIQTGLTLDYLSQVLCQFDQIERIDILTVFNKGNKTLKDFKYVDNIYYGENLNTDQWVIFPWEV